MNYGFFVFGVCEASKTCAVRVPQSERDLDALADSDAISRTAFVASLFVCARFGVRACTMEGPPPDAPDKCVARLRHGSDPENLFQNIKENKRNMFRTVYSTGTFAMLVLCKTPSNAFFHAGAPSIHARPICAQGICKESAVAGSTRWDAKYGFWRARRGGIHYQRYGKDSSIVQWYTRGSSLLASSQSGVEPYASKMMEQREDHGMSASCHVLRT